MEQSEIEHWLPEQGTPRPVDGSPLEDRWIFSRLHRCAEQMNRSIESYRYHEAAQAVWAFFWHEFCDWYVELKKPKLMAGSGMTPDWQNLLTVFEAALRLLHPVLPFLTEEIWQRLLDDKAGRPRSIAIAAYPPADAAVFDEAAERDIETLQEIITSARNLRAELKLDPKEQLDGVLYSAGRALEVARDQAAAVERLAGAKLALRPGHAPKIAGAMRATPDFDLGLEVPAAQLEVLRKRLQKEIEQLEKNIANSRRQLSDDTFLGRAPMHVVEGIRGKLAEYEAQRQKSSASLASLG